MQGAVHKLLEQEIPGVKRAGQKRSKLLQDKFVRAGRKVLLKTRLDDLPTKAFNAASPPATKSKIALLAFSPLTHTTASVKST